MADDKGCTEPENNDTPSKKRPGILSRMLSGILKRDDFEKRLRYISKAEEAILARMKRRSYAFRRVARNFIVLSVILEVVAVFFAFVTTRSMAMNWKMRVLRILPMFLLPALSLATHWAFVNFTKMRDRRDQKTLERLRAERQEKINELKERTNYYTTQQIIQRYDPDPAAKAAAATVLASKLGADSGLKVLFGDETNSPAGRSNDVELVQSNGLRNRKSMHSKSNSTADTHPYNFDQQLHSSVEEEYATSEQGQLSVNHHQPQGSRTHDGGWIARIAALLVGEDPTQCYALICGNCHMHNGLARKEDFPYVTYYCPHCHALNKPKQSEEHVSGSHSATTKLISTGCAGEVGATIAGSSASDSSISTTTGGFGDIAANGAGSSVNDNNMTTTTDDADETKAKMASSSASDSIITTNLPVGSIPDANEESESRVLEDNTS